MRKMTQGSIARHLIAYALPLILGNLFQLTYNAVDSIVIGKFAGENALAAVSAANPVMTIMILGVSGVSIGASVLMSRFYGAGDEDALRREVATTIVFGGAASVAAFLFGWPLSEPVLRLMRVPDEILAMATRYLQVIFVGFLFTFQYNILAAALRSVGDSKTPVIFLALASVMNAGLDVLLVAVFRWGVVGAGVATVMAEGISALLCAWHIYRRIPLLHLARRELKIDRRLLRETVSSGAITVGEEVEAQVDTLILGCTHYPLIAPIIADLMGPEVALIDPGRETALAARDALASAGLLREGRAGTARYYVSDTTESFAQLSDWFLGEYAGGPVTRISVDGYPVEQGAST